jgi:hypothetical protein
MKYITYTILSIISAIVSCAVMGWSGMFISFTAGGIIMFFGTSAIWNFLQWLAIDFISRKTKNIESHG